MGKEICSVDGCGRPHEARGLCNAHYLRLRKHGSPFGGSAPRNIVDKYYQEVVLRYDGDDCLIWPHARDKKGYATFSAKKKQGRERPTQSVARRVCEDIFGTPFPEAQAAHSCGKGHLGCVAKTHLRWATPTSNQRERVLHGTSNRGERHANVKLTETEVRKIRSLQGIHTHKAIGEKFGVTESAVYSILSRKTWAWLD